MKKLIIEVIATEENLSINILENDFTTLELIGFLEFYKVQIINKKAIQDQQKQDIDGLG